MRHRAAGDIIEAAGPGRQPLALSTASCPSPRCSEGFLASSVNVPGRVLIIGATGMLGRPVARRLAAGGFFVRALARDAGRAHRLLPAACQVVRGDVRDTATLAAAMEQIDSVYINLSPPRSPRKPDPESEGTPRIIEAARRSGVRHLLKISFMGVPESAGHWWHTRRKAESERAIIESGIDYTILQPTWFMESLMLLRLGRRILLPAVEDRPIWWIAGDDYASQVEATLRSRRARNRSYVVQGPEPASFLQACRRFGAAWTPPLPVRRIPMWTLRAAAPLATDVRYVLDLLRVTFQTNTVFRARDAWEDLGRPATTIEQYARSMQVPQPRGQYDPRP